MKEIFMFTPKDTKGLIVKTGSTAGLNRSRNQNSEKSGVMQEKPKGKRVLIKIFL